MFRWPERKLMDADRVLVTMRSMDARTFLSEWERLKRSVADRGEQGCYASVGCENCSRCMFCEHSKACHRCNYAVDCQGCTHCTHIKGCLDCSRSTHLSQCTRCADSQYLVRCTDCVECTYCYGCVGLVGKEFYILNERYDRKTYFKVLKALAAEGL